MDSLNKAANQAINTFFEGKDSSSPEGRLNGVSVASVPGDQTPSHVNNPQHDTQTDNWVYIESRDIGTAMVGAVAVSTAPSPVKVDPKEVFNDGNTHLLQQSQNGNSENVSKLIAAGADVNAQNKDGQTALSVSTRDDVSSILIGAGAKTGHQDKYGDTPIHHAAEKHYLGKLKQLLASGGNSNAKNAIGDTPLHIAIKKDYIQSEIVDTLLDNGADVNSKNNHGETPVHLVAETGNVEMLKKLKNHGADLHTVDNHEQNALHYATNYNFIEALEFLLDNGVYINQIDSIFGGPLHLAVYKNFIDTTACLLKHGADINIKNRSGKTALDIAKDHNVSAIIDMLENKLAENS